MGEHSTLRLLHKLVCIISFFFLWHPYSKGLPYGSEDPSCLENKGLPCDEVAALQTLLDTLGLALASSITRSYCTGKSDDFLTIKCNCSDSSMNLCHITEITVNSKSLRGYIREDVSDLVSLGKLPVLLLSSPLDAIDLSSNQLYGTIPGNLGNFSSLTILDLHDNQLTGSIPDSLGNLQFLTSLDLSHNQLSCTIPDGLGNLSMLTHLDLGFNQLNGRIPVNLENLQSLTQLSLHYNKLEGRIPDQLGNLTKLEILRLDENLLIHCLPKSLGRLSNLRILSLTSNNFNGTLRQSYSKLTRLEEFSVAGNIMSGQIQKRIRSYIKNCVNLTKLNLLGNNFEGPLPVQTFHMTELKYLLVSDLYLSNTVFRFPENANLKNINQLVLRNCSITGQIPLHIGNWTRLTHLDLSFNNLTGRIPDSLNDTNLREMYLTGNMLNGMVPGWINTVLSKADLSYNNFLNVTYPEAKKKHILVYELLLFNRNAALNNPTYATSQKINIVPTRDSIVEMNQDYCQDGKSKYHSLFINSGGEEANINGKHYEADKSSSNFYVSDKRNWAYTCSGDFGSSSYNSSDYIKNLTCGVSVRDHSLYEKARLCPVSLTYYGFCLHKGSYTVKLHFAEVVYAKNEDYSSLGKRVFDVYVQGERVLEEFNIKEKAGGPNEVWVENITAQVNDENLLTIHFYWVGKGSIYNPLLLNGPLISAISVTPNFKVGGLAAWKIVVITIAAISAPLLLLALAWQMDLVGYRELSETVELGGQSYALNQIMDVTLDCNPKFDVTLECNPKFKIGGKRSRKDDKVELPDRVVGVKKLHPKLMLQEGDQIQTEIDTLKSLEHENLIQVLDYISKKDLHLLIYADMEHGTLEDALFGPNPLSWEARFKICKGIAKGLEHLHEGKAKGLEHLHEGKAKGLKHPHGGTENNIIHGDLRTSNILLDGSPTPTAKLTKFGLARFGEENLFFVSKEQRTLAHMAPEYALQKPITVKADVYSFGVVLLEIVSGERNEECKDGKETVFLLDKASDLHANGRLLELVDGKLSNNYNKKEATIVLKLAMICVNQFPNRRPKMSEVVSVLEGEKTIE